MHFTLRGFQPNVVQKIRENVKNGHKRLLVSCPTGFGKTIIAAYIAESGAIRGNKTLFTSHRIALADQTLRVFKPLEKYGLSFMQGDSDGYNSEAKITVATLQTLLNREIEAPNMVIIDEVHYAYESKLVQSLFERWPEALFIGLSATPLDDRGYLLEGFDSIIDDYQTGDLIKAGWLVPFKVFSPVQPDLTEVKLVAGEYEEAGVLKALEKANITRSVVSNYLKNGENRKFVCFGVNQAHARELHEEFSRQGVKTAVIISSTKDSDRDKAMADLDTGAIQGLINVEILTAGFDNHTVSLVMLVCPTKNWKKYIQCCGRGIRLLGDNYEESVANGKSDCILLDCAGAVLEHGMPDERKVFKFRAKIGKVIDRELKVDENTEDREERLEAIPTERRVWLKQISSVLDLYDGKEYTKEADLQDDINKFLERLGWFQFRQNSGKAFMPVSPGSKDGRWVHFTNKHGLPDNAVWFRMSSFYFGLELKLSKGALSNHQRETLPEMTAHKVLFFIVESVLDAYHAIEHVERNVVLSEGGDMLIKRSIYTLDERQLKLRSRLKIPMYATH